ncbi:MAG: glycosyltransferase family A protein [Hyphomicrobiales bacterium]
MLTIVTTCKNRLDHLKQTLPLMLRQPRAEVVVVDYGCDQGTANWVRTHHPAARVVEVRDDPEFVAARARNIGAGHAGGTLLCFVDADVIMRQDLAPWLQQNQRDGQYYVAPQNHELMGFLVVSRAAFTQSGGYDEAWRCWGTEDMELRQRLQFAGLTAAPIPADFLSVISHGDASRMLGARGGLPGKAEALTFGRIYREIMADAHRLTGQQLPRDARAEVFRILGLWARNENDDQRRIRIVLTLPMPPRRFAPVMPARRLVYDATTMGLGRATGQPGPAEVTSAAERLKLQTTDLRPDSG